jgi:putative transcriptional regulator
MTAKKLSKALMATAEGMHRIGVMDDATYEKISVRHLGSKPLLTAQPISGAQIRQMRDKARLSQAAFARYLNLTVGYVSQLERGTKQPKGPALALLNVIHRKGLEAIL